MSECNHRFSLNIKARTYQEALELYHMALEVVAREKQRRRTQRKKDRVGIPDSDRRG